jgi:rRNA-processing protein FCF1
MASDRLWGNPEKKIVVLDTNAILMLFEFSINLKDELTQLLGKNKIIIPKPILDELNFLSTNGKGKQKKNAKPALELIKKYEIIETKEDIKGDDAVLYFAQKLQAAVVTNDRELIKRLKDLSIPVIYLRAKKKLVIE